MLYQLTKPFVLITKKLNNLLLNFNFDVYNTLIKKIKIIDVSFFLFYTYYKTKIIVTLCFKLIKIYINFKIARFYIDKKFF